MWKSSLKELFGLNANLAYHVAPLRLGFVSRDKRRQTHSCRVSKWPSCVLQSDCLERSIFVLQDFGLVWDGIPDKVSNSSCLQSSCVLLGERFILYCQKMSIKKQTPETIYMSFGVNSCVSQIIVTSQNIEENTVTRFGFHSFHSTFNRQCYHDEGSKGKK